MIKFDGDQLTEDYEKAFGTSVDDLTVSQMRWLVNLVKHCRGRCRNNTALNNYLNRNFPFTFQNVPVEGKEYTVLQIKGN